LATIVVPEAEAGLFPVPPAGDCTFAPPAKLLFTWVPAGGFPVPVFPLKMQFWMKVDAAPELIAPAKSLAALLANVSL
jgi:hypothetical protein